MSSDELRVLIRRAAQTPGQAARVDALKPFESVGELESRTLAAASECVVLRKRGGHADVPASLGDPAGETGLLPGGGYDPGAGRDARKSNRCRITQCRHALLFSAERQTFAGAVESGRKPARRVESTQRRIANKILPSGEIDDRASPELARIRHEITGLAFAYHTHAGKPDAQVGRGDHRMSWSPFATTGL